MTPAVVNYVPPPIWAAVLVVERDGRASLTPFADHLIQSNVERRRYPDHDRPSLMWIPITIQTAIREDAWRLRHVD